MQIICLKLSCSQTLIHDLSQPGTSKKGKNPSILWLKERKTSLMQLKRFFLRKADT